MRNDPEARAREIARRIAPNGTWIEIGVLRGQNAKRVLEQRPDVHYVGVDPWRAPDAADAYARSGSSDSRYSQAQFDRLAAEAVARLQRFGARARVLRMTSSQAAITLYGEVDLAFIDGSHHYEDVIQDIRLWGARCRVLGGHDYGKPDTLPGVTQAVDELVPDRMLGQDSTWWRPCLDGAGAPIEGAL